MIRLLTALLYLALLMLLAFVQLLRLILIYIKPVKNAHNTRKQASHY